MAKTKRRQHRALRPLERKRLALDMSQGDLAKKIGVTKAAISRWETGLGVPGPGMYSKLAAALGITAEEVVDLVSQRQQEEMASAK